MKSNKKYLYFYSTLYTADEKQVFNIQIRSSWLVQDNKIHNQIWVQMLHYVPALRQLAMYILTLYACFTRLKR